MHTAFFGVCMVGVAVLLLFGGLARPLPIAVEAHPAVVRAAQCAPDDLALDCPAMLGADAIDTILASYGSPAVGSGQAWIDAGARYGINPEIALAFFIHESSAGTNPGWAGLKPGGGSTHNVGNIICAGYASCFGRFRDYASWDDGIEDWYRLIAVEYVEGRGHRTAEDVIPVYAPSFENDVGNYIGAVRALVAEWRQQQ